MEITVSGQATLELRKSGYRCRTVTDWGDIDTVALHHMITEAWRHDYRDDVRPDLDAAFLRNLTRGGSWLAAVCEDSGGRPVGFEIAVPRRLRFGRSELSCWYVTAFSVDCASRRRGIGRWVLETINDAVFRQRGADLIFSTFQGGKAGSSTVQATYDAHGLTVRKFHESPVLVLRADAASLPGLDQSVAIRRVFIDSGRQLRRTDSDEDENVLPTLTQINEMISAQHAVSFALAESFLSFLSEPPADESGGYWVAFDDGSWCFMTCTVTKLAYNDAAIGSSLLLQTVLHEGCTNDQLEQCLSGLAHLAFRAGHRALVAYDHSQMPPRVFRALGFDASGQFYLSVRGAEDIIHNLEPVSPPYFVDFT